MTRTLVVELLCLGSVDCWGQLLQGFVKVLAARCLQHPHSTPWSWEPRRGSGNSNGLDVLCCCACQAAVRLCQCNGRIRFGGW